MVNGKAKEFFEKKSPLIALICALLILVSFLVFLFILPRRVASVDGNPVYEEEFILLLREGRVQYEQRLRAEYEIPDNVGILEFLENDKTRYSQLMAEQNIATLVRLRIQQQLAQEENVVERAFSYNYLLEKMQEENEARAEKHNRGEVVYGLQRFAPEQYYSHFMSTIVDGTLKAMSQKEINITGKELEEYYQSLNYPAYVAGEKMNYTFYDITEIANAPDEEIEIVVEQATQQLILGTDKEIDQSGKKFHPVNHNWTSAQLREFVRKGPEAEQALLALLDTRDVSPLFRAGDQWVVARYDGFSKALVLEESEISIIRSQMCQNFYEKLVAERIQQANVEWDVKTARNICKIALSL